VGKGDFSERKKKQQKARIRDIYYEKGKINYIILTIFARGQFK